MIYYYPGCLIVDKSVMLYLCFDHSIFI